MYRNLSKKNIILFGASNFGKITYEKLKSKYNISFFCDNDHLKWGKSIYGIKIISPEKLNTLKNKIVVITSYYFFEIAKQLIKLNIREFGIAYLVPKYDMYANKYIDDIKIKFFDFRNKDLITKENKIALFVNNNSGSNTYLLNKMKPQYIKDNYDIVEINSLFSDNEKDAIFDVLTSKMIITTHSYRNYIFKDKYHIKLWHGFPLKGIGSMSKNKEQDVKTIHECWNKIDKITSYSQLYTTLMNACFGGRISQYTITGMPRNDFLFNSNGRQILSRLLDINLNNKKLAFYMPTFRISKYTKEVNGTTRENIFGFRDFNIKKFDEFLSSQDIKLIIKLHPYEEAYVLKNLSEWVRKTNNIVLLKNDLFTKNRIDLYEVLNAADMLITDYSSVYFDFLLLDKPIIFTPTDLEQYGENRGFLLEPYELWTPGPKVLDQMSLQYEMNKSLNDIRYYKKERKWLKDIAHYYQDNNSSYRVWSLIDKIMKNEHEFEE